MLGGFGTALERNRAFFAAQGVRPAGSRTAVDLGAGCGFQSIPLAELGFAVTAVDIDRKLLDELEEHAQGLDVVTAQDDLGNFGAYAPGPLELAVCMVDTLIHLESRRRVLDLFSNVAARLETGGRLILTFRDLAEELRELDRFIPVRADDETIFTCFLEYEPETVKVHDLVYRRIDGEWTLRKSFYRKLRLAKDWVDAELSRAGFSTINSTVDKGFVTVVAKK
jgi:SAM-dependent methyltransferase